MLPVAASAAAASAAVAGVSASAAMGAVDEMLRPFDRQLDGPPDSAEARRYRIVQGERICGWSCDPSGPYYEQDKHLCPRECLSGPGSDSYIRNPAKPRFEMIRDVCAGRPPLQMPVAPSARAPTCADDAAGLAASGVWLLIGVQTGPAHRGRRDGVRASWKRWERDTPGVLVCFLIGRIGVSLETLALLDAESKENGDVLWLPNATDAGVPTIKGYHWWKTAARLLPPMAGYPGQRIAAKVDDDSFLHVGNLVADMKRMHCSDHLHYGSMAYTGYDPSIWKLCGWSWQPHGVNYRKERCARRGAYPPFPFMNGVLELLSAPLVQYVARSAEVGAFVGRAERAVQARIAAGWGMSLKRGQRGPRVWRQNEDVALGYWLSRAERKGQFNVTWVRHRILFMLALMPWLTPSPACPLGAHQRPRDEHGMHLDKGHVPEATAGHHLNTFSQEARRARVSCVEDAPARSSCLTTCPTMM